MGHGLILTERIYWPVAHWEDTTFNWQNFDNSGDAAAPTVTPHVGSNQSFASGDFIDANLTYLRAHLRLPSDWYAAGPIDLRLLWFTPATSGNVVWSVQTAYRAEGGVGTLDPAFNAAATVTTAAPGVANRLVMSELLALSKTGAVAPCLMFLGITRDPTVGGDTLSNTASLVGVECSYQRIVTMGP